MDTSPRARKEAKLRAGQVKSVVPLRLVVPSARMAAGGEQRT